MSVEKVIGKWDSLIGKEFHKPYMHAISKSVKEKKNPLFGVEHFRSNKDMFHHFKLTDPNTVKALIITHTAKFNPDILFDIEHDLKGLDLSLTTQTDYNWLYNQGIMIYPMTYSWDEIDGKVNATHKEWWKFTEKVLLDLTEYRSDIIIACDISPVNLMLRELRYGIKRTDRGYGSWRDIDEWCKSKFKKEIIWSP